jgi:polysaccharide biosynthesis transport protein
MNKDEIVVRPYLHHALPTRRDVAAVVFRHWKSMLVVGAVIVLGTVLFGMWTPGYEAQMKILVESRRTDAVVSSSSVTPVQFSGNTVSEEDLNSEVELLKGDDLLRKVALSTGLAGQAGDGGRPAENEIGAAARRLARALSVEAIRKTHVISVRYRSRDPRQAAAVLAALASAYV